jgi:hypothetical protein
LIEILLLRVIYMARGLVDVSVVVGVIVVFAIIGAAIFGVYYFLIYVPAQQRLEDARIGTLGYLDETLGSIATSQAETTAASYRTQVQDAGSTEEVAAIRSEITSAYNRESKRADLLAEVELATNGTFHSFPDLESSLRSEINALTTLPGLQSYEESGTIGTQATSEWKSEHTSMIGGLTGDRIVMRGRDSPEYVQYMSKDEALENYVQANSWSVLRELRFESAGSYEVPILDTFQHAPTVHPGSIVDIYLYDYSTGDMSLRVGGTTVRSVIYPKEELGTIAWTFVDGVTSYSYSTDVWEAIKAATAGDSEAATFDWQQYAQDLMESALSAGVGDFDLQALYIIEVPAREDAAELTQYEQYMSSTKDVVLLTKITS